MTMASDCSIFFSRSEMIFGCDAMKRLREARVILFGVGGVGSWAAETLIRTGLSNLTIVDFDTVSPTNINRQLPAMVSTIGKSKVEAMKSHLLDINPEANISAINRVYNAESADEFDFNQFDFVIDAIDSVKDKALLINNATRSSVKLVSSMGAALKVDPTKIKIANFEKVEGCRLAAALRQRFKREGIFPARKFKCVFSTEQRHNKLASNENLSSLPIDKKIVNGSLMQITSIFGIMIASIVVNSITGDK